MVPPLAGLSQSTLYTVVQNFNLQEGEGDVCDMYLIEAQHTSWNGVLQDAVSGQVAADAVMSTVLPFLSNVWDVPRTFDA
eukprot:jgi/Chrzof1/13233/Cz07g25180.t1